MPDNKRAYYKFGEAKGETAFRKASDTQIKKLRDAGRLTKVRRVRGV